MSEQMEAVQERKVPCGLAFQQCTAVLSSFSSLVSRTSLRDCLSPGTWGRSDTSVHVGAGVCECLCVCVPAGSLGEVVWKKDASLILTSSCPWCWNLMPLISA